MLQVEDLECEIEALRNELQDKELRMQKQLKEVEAFWQSKLYQEKASHSVETNALKEALNILRSQIATPTTSWTSPVFRNKFKPEGEVRQVDHLSGEGGNSSGLTGFDIASNPVLTGFDVGSNPVSSGFGSKPVCDAWTQLPGMAGNPSEALSSVAMAYQVFPKFQLMFRPRMTTGGGGDRGLSVGYTLP